MPVQPSSLSDEESASTTRAPTYLTTTTPVDHNDHDWSEFDDVMKLASILVYTRIPLGCIAFIFNLIAIRIFWLITSDKAPPMYVFLFCLCVSRSVNCLHSFYIALMDTKGFSSMNTDELVWYYSFWSHLLYPLYEIGETAIVWLLVFASIERIINYFGSRRVLRKRFRNRHECLKIIIGIYLFALAFNISRFFEYHITVHDGNNDVLDHSHNQLHFDQRYPRWYYMIYSVIIYGIVNMSAYTLLIILNIFNTIGALKSRASLNVSGDGQHGDISQQRWLAMTVVISCFSYMIFTTPYHVIHWLLNDWDNGTTMPFEYLYLFYVTAKLLSLFNVVFSIIVYFICLTDFRRKFFDVIVFRYNWSRDLAERFRRRFLPGHESFSVGYSRGIDEVDDNV